MSERVVYQDDDKPPVDRGSCFHCGGRGWRVTCVDDMCHGQDECIHGDPPTPCPECNADGSEFDEGP